MLNRCGESKTLKTGDSSGEWYRPSPPPEANHAYRGGWVADYLFLFICVFAVFHSGSETHPSENVLLLLGILCAESLVDTLFAAANV